jgi:hypothetical protein
VLVTPDPRALFYPQVVQEVLLWSRAPMEVRRLCARKEELFRELRGDAAPAMPPGTEGLLQLLDKHNVSGCSAVPQWLLDTQSNDCTTAAALPNWAAQLSLNYLPAMDPLLRPCCTLMIAARLPPAVMLRDILDMHVARSAGASRAGMQRTRGACAA